jgi:hypothetical protein
MPFTGFLRRLAACCRLPGLVLGLALVLSVPAVAQVDEATAERVMKSSGLWEQLAELGPQLKAGFRQAAGQPGLPPDAPPIIERLASVTDEAFNAVSVRLAARRELAARLDPAHLPALQRWLDSDLGRRVTALEVSSSAAKADTQERQRQGQALFDAASPARQKLVEDFLDAARNAETGASAMVNLLLAMQTGMARALGRTDLPPMEELRRRAQPQFEAMALQMRPVMRALGAELYAPLSDADFGAYVAMLQSPAGRNLTEAAIAALDRVMLESAEELGRLAAPR